MTSPDLSPMQDPALTVDRFLDHGAFWHPRAGVVTATAQGDVRSGYAGLRDRANRLSGGLLDLGLVAGDRIATLAWNTSDHVELWYAAMGVGLVCHTLNPRLTARQLIDMIEQADDQVLAVAADLAPLAVQLRDTCPRLRQLIMLDRMPTAEEGQAGFVGHDALVEGGRPVVWGRFDERSPAGLCFTSGTTGAPKGVIYTHRSNYLHTLRLLQADAMALTAADQVLVAVPMFHANAWGLPFAAPAVGAGLVLPGRVTDGAALAGLIERAGVTVAVGVPTVWLGLLDHLDATSGQTPSLKRVIVGGSPCPEALLARMETRLGCRVQTSWGMTELSPLGAISPPGAPAVGAGRPPVGLDLLLTDAAGVPLPQQRNVEGRLKVRGQSVLRTYHGASEPAVDADGWFDTGDLASIDDDGVLTLAGRSKDLIKSGGEWINPVEIEDIVGALPAVGLVAVIGRSDPKWGERPLMVVEPANGQQVEEAALKASLKGRVADWWIPDSVVCVPSMPLAGTGKIDKTQLRARYGGA